MRYRNMFPTPDSARFESTSRCRLACCEHSQASLTDVGRRLISCSATEVARLPRGEPVTLGRRGPVRLLKASSYVRWRAVLLHPWLCQAGFSRIPAIGPSESGHCTATASVEA